MECFKWKIGELKRRRIRGFQNIREVGYFSVDSQRRCHPDRSQMAWLSKPPRDKLCKKEVDLNYGFKDSFIEKDEKPDDLFLHWIANHWIPNQLASKSDKSFKLPQIITSRGVLANLMCTPNQINKNRNDEPWTIVAQKFKGTVYLNSVDTEIAHRGNEDKLANFQGHKFEKYLAKPDQSTTFEDMKRATVDRNEGFYTVVKRNIGDVEVLIAAEVDCCKPENKTKPSEGYVELKTATKSRLNKDEGFFTDEFLRHKAWKWWAQSHLVGIPEIICGFKEKHYIVAIGNYNTEDFATRGGWLSEEEWKWDKKEMLNFLGNILLKIVEKMDSIELDTVCVLHLNKNDDTVSVKMENKSTKVFLPSWYTEALNDLPSTCDHQPSPSPSY